LHNVPEYGFVDEATTAEQAAMFKISIENSTALRYGCYVYVLSRVLKVCYFVKDTGYINLHIDCNFYEVFVTDYTDRVMQKITYQVLISRKLTFKMQNYMWPTPSNVHNLVFIFNFMGYFIVV